MTAKSKRGVGRPRATGAVATQPAREAIMLAAANLFATQGYNATTTRNIAERVGIRQPSVFYHFKKKEDILLAIIDASTIEVSAILDGVSPSPGNVPAELYWLLRRDYDFLLTEPFEIGKLLSLPEMHAAPFGKRVSRIRTRLINAYRRLIKQGMQQGDFQKSDVGVTAYTIFGMGESIWSWYRHPEAWYEKPVRLPPEQVSEQIADLALRSLLLRKSRLGPIKRAAGYSG